MGGAQATATTAATVDASTAATTSAVSASTESNAAGTTNVLSPTALTSNAFTTAAQQGYLQLLQQMTQLHQLQQLGEGERRKREGEGGRDKDREIEWEERERETERDARVDGHQTFTTYKWRHSIIIPYKELMSLCILSCHGGLCKQHHLSMFPLSYKV